MSGHSKWSTIKYKKGAADQARSKVFAKLIRQLEVTARDGGSDPETNPSLRTIFQKARDASMPMDTIDRAIKRGSGELEGVRYEATTYEGYAPGGVAVIAEALTDNRNRTAAEIRNLFNRNGGSMAEPGAVSWQFERKGILELDRSLDEEKIMEVAVEAGAEDLSDSGERWVLTSAAHDLAAVRDALVEAGVTPISAELTLEPTTTVAVTDENEAKKVLHLLELIDDHDDVQSVHANYDIADEVLATFDA
jgi:YebC/PmpR family DNA-binding regulatory protein